ncbi:MAG: hypothetical protein Fur0012_06010 [Elusimicrobiota bacterium]
MSLVLKKGKIIVHNAFDVGWEVNLSKAQALLAAGERQSSRFKFSKDPRKAIIIKEAPLRVELPPSSVSLQGKENLVTLNSRIWDYGVISVNLEIDIENMSWENLLSLSEAIENGEETENLAIKIKDELKARILPAVKNPQEWDYFEDYITYFAQEVEGASSPMEIMEKADIASLILAEEPGKLSPAASLPITENYLQYYKNDLAVIDWNSAFIYEPSGNRDVADVIEFSLTHLLELRFYDYLIDKRLDELYDTIHNEKNFFKRILKAHYEKLAMDAGRNYVEFSDFIGKVENSLKTVGDPYVATVFRVCAEQFRFEDWYQSISRKMKTLFEITQIFQGEITAMRSHILEIIVIILIAIEVIPFLFLMNK